MNVKVKLLSVDSAEIWKQLDYDKLPMDFSPWAAAFISITDTVNTYTGILYIGYLQQFIPYSVIKPGFGNLSSHEHICSAMISTVQTMVLDMIA